MERKAGWLLIVCIALAAASLVLPTSHAERSRSAESARQHTNALGRSVDLLRIRERNNSLGSWFPSLRASAFRSFRASHSIVEDVPPTCSQVVTTGPPKKVVFTIQDTGSGLDAIVVNRSQNAITVSDAFTPEITEPVTVDSTKVDEAFPMMIDLTITDVDGNVHQCNFSDAVTSAGATIVEESCSPANGAIDPGETVTISFCVQNLDSPSPDQDTAALIGTLQSSGGVTSPSGPQSYGVVVAGGPPVCRNFTFTASGSCGGTVTASLDLVDGDTNHGTVTYDFTLGVEEVCCAPAECSITCPANVTQSNDPNQCGAVVNYPAPTTTGDCGAVTCSPASGSFFPVGTTTVTCQAAGDGPSCTFTVTVNDTQPPTITCPANQVVTGAPDTTSAVGNYPAPGFTDNCPGGNTVCVPASGSSFPQGTTTVTCTRTDNSGNTATCSFTLRVNIPPGANDDHYFTFLNQPLNIAAPGVLTNDTGFPAPTAVPGGGATTAGGTYSLNADGSFSYTPPPGFTGNDGFNYTATNTAGSDTAHVTLTVTDPATISLRISEFRENGPGAGGFGAGVERSSKSGDDIVIEVLNPARDEFIEIYNHTPTDVQVGTTLASNSGGIGVF
ncbi:MAG TPA: HYR domain-containing protein, partial [Pyrinomonadaceae bacterium]|nr:HYR domain-containing protein [Pyrinomonadaceae bacterium]